MPLSPLNLDVALLSTGQSSVQADAKGGIENEYLALCRCAIAPALLGILSAYGDPIPNASERAAAAPAEPLIRSPDKALHCNTLRNQTFRILMTLHN
jgi:hypothetical protein